MFFSREDFAFWLGQCVQVRGKGLYLSFVLFLKLSLTCQEIRILPISSEMDIATLTLTG